MTMRRLYETYPDLKTVELHGDHRIAERMAVLQHAPHDEVGAEIGVFTGLFADVLAQEVPSTCIYLVDPWSRLHGTHFPNWGRYTANLSLSVEAARAAVEWRAQSADSTCVIVEAFGAEWLNTHDAPFLGWAYLDGNHAYDSVLADLTALDRCLLPHGTIMGDDMWIRADGRVSDVYFAVRRFCRAAGFELIHADQHGQWAIRRSAFMDSIASRAQSRAMRAVDP